MKSIFAGIGFIGLIALIVGLIYSPGAIRSAFDGIRNDHVGYENIDQDSQIGITGPVGARGIYGIPSSYNPGEYGSERGCLRDDCRRTPGYATSKFINSRIEYSEERRAPSRIWVQPVYRTQYVYGHPRNVIVQQGYWRTESRSGSNKHFGFNFAGLFGQ